MLLRPAHDGDHDAIAAIQQASPEASAWDPTGYDVTVAELDGEVVGFIVTRRVAPDEVEILNLAVAPSHRRKGVARALVSPLLANVCDRLFLEVRESNRAALHFYEAIGFKVLNTRKKYYSDPLEAGIVMNFHS